MRQPTNQRAVLRGGKLVAEKKRRPAKVAAEYDGGDGTVPFASAIPFEQSNSFRGFTVSDRHGTVQKNPFVLDDIVARLNLLQAGSLAEVRGTLDKSFGDLSPDLEEGYVGGEPVVFRARSSRGGAVALAGRLTAIDTGDTRPVEFHPGADRWQVADAGLLSPGTYRIEVSTPASPERATCSL